MQGPRGYPETPSREVAELESDRALDAPLGRGDALRVGEVEGVAVRAREWHDDLVGEDARWSGERVTRAPRRCGCAKDERQEGKKGCRGRVPRRGAEEGCRGGVPRRGGEGAKEGCTWPMKSSAVKASRSQISRRSDDHGACGLSYSPWGARVSVRVRVGVRMIVLTIRAHRAPLQPHLDPLTLPDGVERALADARAHGAVLPRRAARPSAEHLQRTWLGSGLGSGLGLGLGLGLPAAEHLQRTCDARRGDGWGIGGGASKGGGRLSPISSIPAKEKWMSAVRGKRAGRGPGCRECRAAGVAGMVVGTPKARARAKLRG
eukprot:scaffold44975_cov55-Phaeocystis_antarctica.AAC.1